MDVNVPAGCYSNQEQGRRGRNCIRYSDYRLQWDLLGLSGKRIERRGRNDRTGPAGVTNPGSPCA